MKQLFRWFIALVMALTSACQSIGSVPPKSYEDRYAYAVATNASVREAAAQAVRSGVINRDTGEKVLRGTDTARALLDESLKIAGTDADIKLYKAIEAINSVVQLLQLNGVEVPGL